MNKNFFMVLAGQIISLFGNAIVRFVLPLYLLNITGSSATYGIVSAIAFIPMLLLMPVGGIIADRINKRNIMVFLDFSTAVIILLFALTQGHLLGNQSIFIILMLITMFLLYSIQGLYQPAVQASIPLLVDDEHLITANSLINIVSSASSLLGPVIAGVVYSLFGISSILYLSVICFFVSAVMELFIVIPFTKMTTSGNIISIGVNDFKDSLHFITFDQPAILKVCILSTLLNLFASSCLIIGLPVIITQHLGFDPALGSKLLGYSEGAFGAGSLLGAAIASILGNKLSIKKVHIPLCISACSLLPVSWVLGPGRAILSGMSCYYVLVSYMFIMMTFCMIFNIRIMAELQLMTPNHMLGKVIGCVFCLCSCAQPVGQALFGILFEAAAGYIPIIFLTVCAITFVIAVLSGRVFNTYAEKAGHLDSGTSCLSTPCA